MYNTRPKTPTTTTVCVYVCVFLQTFLHLFSRPTVTQGTEKAFVQRCKDSFKKHGSFVPDKGSSLQFTIRHYAGSVLYKAPGFVEKNKDSLPDMLVEAVKYGKVKLVSMLFRRSANPSSELKKSVLRKRLVLVIFLFL